MKSGAQNYCVVGVATVVLTFSHNENIQLASGCNHVLFLLLINL